MVAPCRGNRFAEYRARFLVVALRFAFAGVGLVLLANAAQSQQITEAQKGAIKSSCRSDYMSNCMSVRPGGIEALQCLKKNMAKLSPACHTAVSAATPKAAPSAPPPAAPAAAAPPALAPAAAVTAPAPAPAAPAIVHAPPPPAAVATPPRDSVATPPHAKAGAPAPLPAGKRPQQAVAAPPPPPAKPAVATAKIEKLSLRARLRIIKFCRGDRQAVCSTVKEGGGQVVACLAANSPSLSPKCRQFLAKALR